MNMSNIPDLKCGIISVSRDCFIISLSENRRQAIISAYEKKYGNLSAWIGFSQMVVNYGGQAAIGIFGLIFAICALRSGA